MEVVKDVPLKLFNPFKETNLDDKYSQINRICLFAICLVFGILFTVRQYTGHLIVCHGFTKYQHDFAEDFCWTQGLYTIREAYDLPRAQVPYPGLVPELNVCIEFTYANGTKYTCPKDGELLALTRVYHLWYQWIPFYFWICAVVFYLPYIFFHNSEIGQIKPVIRLLHNIMDSETSQSEKINKAAVWLSAKLRIYLTSQGPINFFLRRHKFFFVILFTKVANFIVVMLVIYATENMFAMGSFLSYGVDWISYNTRPDRSDHKTSPKDKLFPKMIACEIFRWGASGLEEEQGMCVLAPNVVNQYFFLIFWFILMLALIVNAFSVLFTTAAMLFTLGQYKQLLHKYFMLDTPIRKYVYFSIGTSGRVTVDIVAKNITPQVFEMLYDNVCKRIAADRGDVYINMSTAKS